MRKADVGPTHTSRAVALVLTLLVAGSLLATVAAAQETQPREDDAAQDGDNDAAVVQRGNDLYGAHCGICHGTEGRGTEDAPAIQDASPALIDFVVRTGRMPLPHPDARSMRREPVLDDEARAALIAYVRTWAEDEPEIPAPDPELGDLSHGRELYETNCIACHSPFGGGIAISQQDLAPALAPADPVEIAEAVRTGPGVMPVFSEDVLDEHDLDSVIRYLLFLRERPRGGLAFGRSGPVTEGLVAWFAGAGLLLMMAYFIGERRE